MLFDRTWLRCFCAVSFSLIVTVSGCNNSEPPAEETVQKEQTTGQTEAERCSSKLAGAIRRLTPETFSLQTKPERSINGLNAWLASCAADELMDLKLPESTLALIDSNVRATVGRFTANDASYIRDCLMLQRLSTSVYERTANDLEGKEQAVARTIAVFNWVVRNISLLPTDESRPSLGLFDVLLTGRGTVEDRAWVFAETLRQQQIDAVIVHSSETPEPEGDLLDTAEWLLAVVLDERLLLFDMTTGLPITEGQLKDPLKPVPAGLAVLQGHARWKQPQVQVIAQIAAFAPRMLVLQQRLAVEDSAVLFEELTGGVSEIRPIIERVTAGSNGQWSADAVTVWEYPESTSVAARSLSEEEQRRYTQLLRPFDAPFERKPVAAESMEELTTVPEELSMEKRKELVQQRLMENFARVMETSQDRFGTPSKRLLKTRVRQLVGANDTGVIQQLQQIRITSMEEKVSVRVPEEIQRAYGYPEIYEIPFPKMVREVNQSSTGDSLYWAAICQMERGEIGAAITTFANYRRQYAEGKWTYPSMDHQAATLLVQGRQDDAVAILKKADTEDNPEQKRIHALLKALTSE